MATEAYDPFERGPRPVEMRDTQLHDAARDRTFRCAVWLPADGDGQPLPAVVYSHHAGGSRLVAAELCAHLASHGHAVAALDHSEVVAPELAGHGGETAEQRAARVDAIVAARLPDLRLLLDALLDGRVSASRRLDARRVALVGHSFGGWAVLAAAEADPRVRCVVAMAPGGSSDPRPGVLRLSLTFRRPHDVPTLYLAAADDVPIPLRAVEELHARTPGTRWMFVLRRADHQHFVDDVAGAHEAVRSMELPGDAAWMPAAMRPMSELSSPEQAHTFVRGLTLAHLDATLRGLEAARRLLDVDAEARLSALGVDAHRHPQRTQALSELEPRP